MPATTATRSKTVASLRRRRCDREAPDILTAHPDDRDGVEQRHQTNEHRDERSVARADRAPPLLFELHPSQCQLVWSTSSRLKTRNR